MGHTWTFETKRRLRDRAAPPASNLEDLRRRLGVEIGNRRPRASTLPSSFFLMLAVVMTARASSLYDSGPVSAALTLGVLAVSSLHARFPRRQRMMAAGLVSLMLLILTGRPQPVPIELTSELVATVEGRIDGWQKESHFWSGILRDVRVLPRRNTPRSRLQELLWETDWMKVSLSSSDARELSGRLFERGCLRFLGVLRQRSSPRNTPPSGDEQILLGLSVPSARLVSRCSGTVGGAGYLGESLGRLRNRLWPVGERCGPGCGLTRALLLGDRSGVDRELRWQLRRSGLSHLLAVSGLHVGLVLGLALLVPRFVPWRLRFWLRVLFALSVLVLYLGLVGWKSSLVRASGMALLFVLAPFFDRPTDSVGFFSWVVISMVLFDPGIVTEVGFALTVLATGGILLAATRPGSSLERCARRVAIYLPWLPVHAATRALVVSAAASVATAPVQIATFHCLYPSSILLNLVAVPFTGFALVVSVSAAVLSLVSGASIDHMAPLLDLLVVPIEALRHLPPRFWITLPIELEPASLFVLSVWLLVIFTSGTRNSPRGKLESLLPTLCVAVLVGSVEFRARAHTRLESGALEITALDVGQGEALLLRTGLTTVLIDGGGWRGGDVASSVLIEAMAHRRLSTIDLMISSHSDWDHCGGLLELATMVRVRELWLAASERLDSCSRNLRAAVLAGGGQVEELSLGETKTLPDLEFRILWPPRVDVGSKNNDRSLVLTVRHPLATLLLTGDIEKLVEHRLLESGSLGRHDVLKMAHHGSRSSSVPPFLSAVRPRLALVSAGRNNRFGHPAGERVRWLELRGTRVLGTHRYGQVRLVFSEEQPLAIETAVALPRRQSPQR